MRNHFRKELAGSWPTDKTAVVGARDRATNQVAARAVESTAKETLQGFVESILADCRLDRCDGQWVPCHLLVSRQEFEALFLGLNEEQFVEWVSVFRRCVEFTGGVSDGDWKKRHVLPLEHRNDVIWIEGALSQTSSSAGIVLQPHLPDRTVLA